MNFKLKIGEGSSVDPIDREQPTVYPNLLRVCKIRQKYGIYQIKHQKIW